MAKIAGGVVRIAWPGGNLSAYGRDVVQGSLTALSASGGDFTVATERCLIDDAQTTFFDDSEMPQAGDGFWYVVREDQLEGCPGWGARSYDEDWSPSTQVGERDLEIATSAHDCSCFYWCCATYDSCE